MDSNTIQDFVISFTAILWEAFPFVVLGAILAGMLEELVPQQAIAKFVPKSAVLATMLGGVLGLVFPMCECGIVAVMRRLLRKGMPLGTCIAYMLAGPIINLIVISSTYVAFQPHGIGTSMVIARCGLGFFVAVSTALIVQYSHRETWRSLLTPEATPPVVPEMETVDESGRPKKKSVFARVAAISETALHDFVDIMVFLILGSILASLAKLQFDSTYLKELSSSLPVVVILIMMGMAVLMCLCSEADAFVAASFTTLAPAPKVAFLVLGPMFDLKLLLMFTRVFRPRLIAIVVVSVVAQVLIGSLFIHYLGLVAPSQAAELVPANSQL